MTTLFISDLHLDEKRPDITAAFFSFLRDQASHAETLYILGDFFEAWIGDDEDSELSRSVVKQLKQLSASGVKLFVMHGNRDFLLGETFCQQTGATLLNDPCVVKIDDQEIVLMHGDSLCTGDIPYMEFRKQARSTPWQAHFLSHSLDQRRALVAHMRDQSKDMNSQKAEDIMDVTPAEVARTMQKAKVRTMIHGHTHRPAIHTLSEGKRYVLGDWDKSFWYISAENNTLELIERPISAAN